MTIVLKRVKLPDYKVDNEAYRIPMRITAIREYHECKDLKSYPLCPRCLQIIEKDYQSFCNMCGQALDWTGYKL